MILDDILQQCKTKDSIMVSSNDLGQMLAQYRERLEIMEEWQIVKAQLEANQKHPD